jgi:diguanylate cyclase (GGDEF)-like protein
VRETKSDVERGSGRPRDAGATAQRARLLRLFVDSPLDPAKLLARLRELRSLENTEVCATVVESLVSVRWSEPRAEEFLEELVRVRRELTERLGRDPGWVVSAMELVGRSDDPPRRPIFVEWSEREPEGRSVVGDPLTRFGHRSSFEPALSAEIRRSRRCEQGLALVVVNLDSFGSVNDLYGHAVGDGVLRLAGRILRQTMRDSDLAWRLDGDEFAWILPRTGRLGAWAAAERLRVETETRFAETPVVGRLVAMTTCCGIACHPEDGGDADALLVAARAAAERAKVLGRNRVVSHAKERRRFVRLVGRPGTRARIGFGEERALREARLLDLGRTGALLESETDADAGQTTLLVLEAAGHSTMVHGRVARRTRAGGPPRTAIAFDGTLDPATVQGFATATTPREIHR